MDEGWTSPEGLWLPKPVHMPDARNFSDVLTYFDEWDSGKTWDHHARWLRVDGTEVVNRPRTAKGNPRLGSNGVNQIGPYCMTQNYPSGYRSMVVRATDAAMEAIVKRGIVTPDDTLSFKVVIHNREDTDQQRALVILEHGYILGSIWLAYVNADTIPPRPERRAA